MASMTVLATCHLCNRVFSCNASYVPSVRVFTETSALRAPICHPCMLTINQLRELKGLTPFAIHPEAYQPEEVL